MRRVALLVTLLAVACTSSRPRAPALQVEKPQPNTEPPVAVAPEVCTQWPGAGASDCAHSDRCAVQGGCAQVDGICKPTEPAHCERSLLCRLYGKCELSEPFCESLDGCRGPACSLQGGNDQYVLLPEWTRAFERRFDTPCLVGRFHAADPPAGAESYTFQADLEVWSDGRFEQLAGETYPHRDQCRLAGQLRVVDRVLLQRIDRTECADVKVGTLRSFALMFYERSFVLRPLLGNETPWGHEYKAAPDELGR